MPRTLPQTLETVSDAWLPLSAKTRLAGGFGQIPRGSGARPFGGNWANCLVHIWTTKNPQNALKWWMWPLEVCTDDGLRIRAAGPAAFLRGVRHDIMSVWCKEGATVWIENGSNGDRGGASSRDMRTSFARKKGTQRRGQSRRPPKSSAKSLLKSTPLEQILQNEYGGKG